MLNAFLTGTMLWLVLSVLIAWFAATRGRSAVGFFFLSLLLSPLVGLVILLIVGDDGGRMPAEQKTCPYCAERIQMAAIVCKHCGKDLRGVLGGEAGITEQQIRALQARTRTVRQ